MRIRINKMDQPNYWYRYFVGLTFDVKPMPTLQGMMNYVVVDSPHNRFMLPDRYHRSLNGNLLVMGSDAEEIEVNNAEMIHLLRPMEEW